MKRYYKSSNHEPRPPVSTLAPVSVAVSPVVATSHPQRRLTIDGVPMRTALTTSYSSSDTPSLLPIRVEMCSYQPRQDGGRGERAGGSGILGSPEVSADILELIRAKTQLCRASIISHSRVQIQARALNASESSRSGIPK
ncbi:hypothetical protein EVAR_94006_1 [Eumeta japonica]|uniref:Uncharacterized protein n=1 Tax=Eumeta variegata TaxID=151549 RepID=A0A4C1TPE6_EUMVA|nr:hypothetical protein EVAR_94006_1 [Eumeta japonica]